MSTDCEKTQSLAKLKGVKRVKDHIHLSTISIAGTVAIVVLTCFLMHQASLTLGSSTDENKALWGKALAAGFGF